MDRRIAIKEMMMATGGLVALPGWARGWTRADVTIEQHIFSPPDEKTLSMIVDTIIPAGTEGVGGISEGVDQFLVRLLDQCYEKDVQENVVHQLANLDQKAKALHGRYFSQCDQEPREALLEALSISEDDSEKDFFDLIKRETLRGFRTSRKVMMRYYDYRVAPGYYFGCVDIEVQ